MITPPGRVVNKYPVASYYLPKRCLKGYNFLIHNLFVYGTIKTSEVQKKVIGRMADSAKDFLEGYSRSSIVLKGITYSILVKGAEEIEGVVLQVTEDELKKFDVFETQAYRRVMEKLKSGIEAWVYVK